MGYRHVPVLLLGLLVAGPRSVVAQIARDLKVYSASGQSRPATLIRNPKGPPTDSVWHIQAHAGDQVLQLVLGLEPGLPAGVNITNNSITTTAFKIHPGVHTPPSTYQLLLDVPAQNTVSPAVNLQASTGQTQALKLHVARPPFGWVSSTCDTRPLTIVTRPATGPVTFEITGIDHPNEVRTSGNHRVRLVRVDDPNDVRVGTFSPTSGKWNASFSPGTASEYRAYVEFETTEPYFDERTGETRNRQEACYPIAVHSQPVTDIALKLTDVGGTRVDNIYPGESLNVEISPSAGALRLAQGEYHVVDGRLQPVGNLRVINTTAVSGQITAAQADVTLTALDNPSTTGRLYIASRTTPPQLLHALGVRVRPVPEVTAVRIRRDAIIRSGEIWSSEPFTFILSGSGLGDHISLKTAPDLRPGEVAASGLTWQATTQPANLAGIATVRLSLTDNRREFALPAHDLKVIPNPVAHPLQQMVTLQGKRASDLGSLTEDERRHLGALKLRLEPPSVSTLGPQHLRLRMTVRAPMVDSAVTSDVRSIQVGPGDQPMEQEIRTLFAGDPKVGGLLEVLRTPGSRVQFALWHDPKAHPEARDTTVIEVINSKRRHVELNLGLTPGAALWRSGAGDLWDKVGDPLAGPSFIFEMTSFDQFGDPKPLRVHAGLLLPKTVVSERQPDSQAGAQADAPVKDETMWLPGVAAGFTFNVPVRGRFAGARVGASVGWLSGGRWMLFLHPGGLDLNIARF